MNSIRSATPICNALCLASRSRIGLLSIAITRSYEPSPPFDQTEMNIPLSQVFANSIVFPPTPQNASIITSALHLSAICAAIGRGVIEYQPVSSRRSGNLSYSGKRNCRWYQSARQPTSMYNHNPSQAQKSPRTFDHRQTGRDSHLTSSEGISVGFVYLVTKPVQSHR